MKKISKLLALIGLATIFNPAQAGEAEIKKALGILAPAEKIDSVKPSEVNGLYEVMLGGSVVYVTEDGKYLLHGQLIETASKKNITESKQAEVRKAELEKVGEQNMIVFKPKAPKHFVSVFTDIDCGYCRKFHSEIDQYLAQGITVRYLFYPRAGKSSESYSKAVAVWCADDRQKALTSAKKGEKQDGKSCENPVDRHMDLASDFGLSGTPMIVTEKGNVLPGYVPAQQLAKILDSE